MQVQSAKPASLVVVLRESHPRAWLSRSDPLWWRYCTTMRFIWEDWGTCG